MEDPPLVNVATEINNETTCRSTSDPGFGVGKASDGSAC
jgi:hypothetical protein